MVTMKKIDLEKYRSIGSVRSGAKNSKKVTKHLDDQGRADGGSQVEHWDGRVDANIAVSPIAIKSVRS